MCCDRWSSSSHVMILRMETMCDVCSIHIDKAEDRRSQMTSWSHHMSLALPLSSRPILYKRIKLQIVKATIFGFILISHIILLSFLSSGKRRRNADPFWKCASLSWDSEHALKKQLWPLICLCYCSFPLKLQPILLLSKLSSKGLRV